MANSSPVTAGLPDIAALDALDYQGKGASSFEFEPLVLDGDAAFLSGPGVTLDAVHGYARLAAPSGKISWVIYRFETLDPQRVLTETESWLTNSADQPVYLALANYAQSRWEIEVITAEQLAASPAVSLQFTQPAPSPYLSPQHNFYLAVIAWDASTVTSEYARLYVGMRNVWVQNLDATDGTLTDQITITWDALAEASGYDLYYRVADQQVPLSLLTSIAGGGSVSFPHSLTNPPGREAASGVEYIYFITATFANGTVSRLSGWDTGYCGTLPAP